jgi:uncharacterized repeat protein (TIGR01451 family)
MGCLLAIFASLLVAAVNPLAAQAARAFASRFSVNTEGNIAFVSNQVTTCPTGCTTANSATMTWYDVDGTPASPIQGGGTVATFNSSTANLTLPALSTVLFAGLYWGGNTASGTQLGGTGAQAAPTLADRNKVYFKTPWMTGYTLVTATTVDDDFSQHATNPVYHAFFDATALVNATPPTGTGTYGVANVQTGLGSSPLGDFGGWTMIVVYRDPNGTLRNMSVFDGFNSVTGTTTVDIPFGPFTTPATGPIRTNIGIVAMDGDVGLVGDAASLNSGTTCTGTAASLSDATNPATNLFNSSISTLGANVTSRNPADANTWGYDADIIAANGFLTNGSTNACLRLKTAGDSYWPGAVTTSTELPSPNLDGIKTVVDRNGGLLNPGDILDYTITVKNNGNDRATNVVLVDPIPAGLTYVPGSINITAGPLAGSKTDALDTDQGTFGANTVTVNLGSGATATAGGIMAAAETDTVTFSTTLNSSVPGGTVISNTATITYKGETLPTVTLSPVVSAIAAAIATQVELSITKTDSQTLVTAGTPISYTLAVKNTGPQTATNALVTDTVPALIINPSWTCSVAGQSAAAACAAPSGVGNLASTTTLGVGDTATFTVSGTVDPAAPAGTNNLTNTATVAPAAGVTDTNLANNSASDTDSIDRKADIVVTKTDGITNAVPGTTVTYTVVVANNGPSTSSGITVVDTVPAALTGVTWSCAATVSSACVAGSGTGNSINTSATVAAGGSATYTVIGTLDPATPAGTNTLVNSATATLPSGILELSTLNNTGSDTDNVTPQSNLSITKTDGITNAIPGTAVTYTVVVSNAGPSTAVNALVADTVPAALTGVSWTCTPSGAGATCGAASGTGNSISQTVTLTTGTTATYSVTGTLNPTTPSGTNTLANTATVSAPSGTTDPVTTNNSATDTDNVVATADLTITKTDGLTNAIPGSLVTYTVNVGNSGPSTITNGAVNDTVPAALTGVTWTCTTVAVGASCASPTGSGNTIATTVTLPASAVASFTITGTLNPGTPAGTGTLTNTAAAVLPVGVTDPTPGPTTAADTDNVTPTVDLAITKTDSALSAVPGAPITYTIVVSNAGPSTATNALVADTVPASITGVSWSCLATGIGASCGAASGSGNSISTTATVPPTTTITYTVSGTLAPGTPAGIGTLVNTATVTAPALTTEVSTLNNSATDTDDVTPRADLVVTKTPSSPTRIPGEALSYTITVTNAGPSMVTGATVTDNLPAGLGAATWTCAITGTGTCTAATGSGSIGTTVNLAPAAIATFVITTSVAASFPGGPLTNTASAAVPSSVTDPTPGNNSADALVNVTATADLSITKSDGTATAVPGNTTTYTIVVSNAGPSAVTGATVADTLPGTLSGANWTCVPSAGASCGATAGAGNISTTVSLPVSGTATFTLTATIAPGATGTISNTATVTAPVGVLEVGTGANSATDIDTLAPAANLSVTKTDGLTTAIPGTSVTYTITVQNAGPSNAPGIAVVDTLPVALSGATWTCTPTPGSSCIAASGSGSISSSVSLLATGSASYSLTATIDPTAIGTLTNTATITPPAGIPDITPLNNTSTDIDTLVPTGDLSITKTNGLTEVIPGTSVTYTIIATNAGPSTAVGAVVADSLPGILLSAAWTCAATAGSTCSIASGLGSISVPTTLAPGGSATFTVTGTVDQAAIGSIANTATISAPSGFTDSIGTNNSATDTDPLVPKGDLSLTKVDGILNAIPGTSITYTISVSNAGPSKVSDAIVSDSVPPELQGVAWSCSAAAAGANCGTLSGSGNAISLGVTLPSGATATITVTGTLAAATPAGSLVNTATVSAPSGFTDTTTLNNSATDTDTVVPTGNISVTKTNGVSTLVPGTATTYTIVVSNTGPSTATGINVVDTLPATLTGATWTCAGASGATCPASGSGSINTSVTVPASGTATFVVTATVAPGATGSLANTVTISTPNGFTDTVTTDNAATDTDTLTPQADLGVTKTDGITNAIPGNALSYTVTVTNAGPSTATLASLSDTVPAAVTGVTWTCAAVGAGASCGAASGSGNAIATSLTLPPGATATYTVNGTLNAATPAGTLSLSNTATATVAAGTTDLVAGNNAATDTDNVTPVADVALTKVSSGSRVAGQAITYTLTATNAGPSLASAVTIADTLPASILTPTWTCTPASGTGNVSALASIPVGATVVVAISGTIDPNTTGSIINNATAAQPPTTTDPSLLNNAPSVTDPITTVTDLSVSKTRSGPAVAGSTVGYSVIVTNIGPSTAVGATLSDPLPANIASSTWTCTASVGSTCGTTSGTNGIATTHTLLPGGTATYAITATIAAASTGSIAQVATVAAAVPANDPVLTNNSATNNATIAVNVDL